MIDTSRGWARKCLLPPAASRRLTPLLLLLACGVAQAGDCSIRVSPVNFGQYDPIEQITPLPATGNVEVDCRAETREEGVHGVYVTIGLGPGSSGTYAARTLRMSADSELRYNLYASPSGGEIWGDGQRGTRTVGGAVGGTGSGQPSPRSFPVYGLIPPGQDPAVGAHGDTIMVTVTF